MNDITRSRGRVVFTQTAGHGYDNTQYARWISTGHEPKTLPDYSIQRFNYRADRNGRCVIENVPTYYKAYYRGRKMFTIAGHNEFKHFDDAASAIDIHFHVHRDD